MGKKDYSNYTKEELIKEVESLKKQKTYGLVWEEDKTKENFDYYINWDGIKNKELFKEAEHKFPVIKEVKNKEIVTGKKQNYNILIEGDNYHSLAVLNFTHKKSIDVIYIDPPYNTGNKDFKYNDQFVDIEDGYRHSKWLSFMEKRLKLARNLLREDGCIFISIDDNEFAPLKILCDEIFGEKNFVSNIIWQKKYSPQNDAKYLSNMHDYILLYAKSKSQWKRNLMPRTDIQNQRYKNLDDDPRGPWKSADLSVKRVTQKDIYEITTPSGRIVMPPKGRSWVLSKQRFKEMLEDNRIWFGKNNNSVPSLKTFLNEVQEGVVPVTWWPREFAGDNQMAKQELKDLLPQVESVFDTPKPVLLIKRLLQLSGGKNSLILDFFAGSGSTAQAVMEMNGLDKGSRRFIMCTNDEGKICSEICYPRLQKIIKGYNSSKGKKVNGLGSNLKYYKTDFVDSKGTDKNKKKLVNESTDMLCIKESAFENVVDTEGYKIFKNDKIHLGIIFDEDSIADFIKEAKKINNKFNVYMFSLDASVPEQDFEEIKDKVTLCPIPEVILQVYRRVFKND